jgi:predicted amidohydrolase YtcJ
VPPTGARNSNNQHLVQGKQYMPSKDGKRTGVSRRDLIKGAASAAVLGSAIGTGAAGAHSDPGSRWDEGNGQDLALVNGRILTLDEHNTVATAVAIRDGRIAEVGQSVRQCDRTIDLRGATVIPGLIDQQCRYLRTAEDPGYQLRILETARSIADLQRMLAERTKTVPAGQWITCFGGWNVHGFTENRYPTPAELDAAAPHHPVLLSDDPYSFSGPGGVTNSRGIAFFAAQGIAVSTKGLVNAAAALTALNVGRPDSDRVRSTADALEFLASVGMTMLGDLGQINLAESNTDQYQWALQLWREKKLNMRFRIKLGNGNDPTLSDVHRRVLNAFDRFGDDRFRVNGIGDGVWYPGGGPGTPAFHPDVKFLAQQRWGFSFEAEDLPTLLDATLAFQEANAAYPIADLRWSMNHAYNITPAITNSLTAMGAGVIGTSDSFLQSPSATPSGPPWRMLANSGTRLGAGTDATYVAQINPWLSMYFMTTGRNNAGQIVNPGQTLTRLEALKTYTVSNTWHSFDEDDLGTLEPGKLADLAVLSANPLSVSDDALRTIRSVLTLQAGRVVYQGPQTSYRG